MGNAAKKLPPAPFPDATADQEEGDAEGEQDAAAIVSSLAPSRPGDHAKRGYRARSAARSSVHVGAAGVVAISAVRVGSEVVMPTRTGLGRGRRGRRWMD